MGNVVYTGFDPAFNDPLQKFMARARTMGYDPSLISGRRDAYGWPGMQGQSQAELYNAVGTPGGPAMAAPPGQSPHQYGVAADVSGIPQSQLEQMAPQFGLRAIHGDPNHIELANWQQTAATQPPVTPWGSATAGTNLNSVPAPASAPPASAPPAAAPDSGGPSPASLLASGDVKGALGAMGSSPSIQSGIQGLSKALGGGGQQAPAPPPMPIPHLQSNQAQIGQQAPQMMAQIMAQQRRNQVPGLSLGGYGGYYG